MVLSLSLKELAFSDWAKKTIKCIIYYLFSYGLSVCLFVFVCFSSFYFAKTVTVVMS